VSSDEPADQTFADVVNGLTLGGGRRRKRGKSVVDNEVAAETPVEVRPHADPWSAMSTSDISSVMGVELSADAAIARPYAWTQGRTKSTVEMRIETMVSTSERGEDVDALTQIEHLSIAELCREPRSVAEVATLLNVPLGVAKVLLGDMAKLGLVIVHKTATGGANKAHLVLMERVLSGLRRL
jgi:hypothetical protein